MDKIHSARPNGREVKRLFDVLRQYKHLTEHAGWFGKKVDLGNRMAPHLQEQIRGSHYDQRSEEIAVHPDQ